MFPRRLVVFNLLHKRYLLNQYSLTECTLSSHRLEGIQDLSLFMDLLTKKGKTWLLGCICNCSLVSAYVIVL
jgi:hypothetical protein